MRNLKIEQQWLKISVFRADSINVINPRLTSAESDSNINFIGFKLDKFVLFM